MNSDEEVSKLAKYDIFYHSIKNLYLSHKNMYLKCKIRNKAVNYNGSSIYLHYFAEKLTQNSK